MSYLYIPLFALAGALLVGGGVLASHLLAPSSPSQTKGLPYECGEETIGSAWMQFNVGYYLFALVFLIFEVEAAFLFPTAVVIKQAGVIGLVEVGIFLLVLVLGLVFAWKKKILEWV
ncbi:MAG: NADH-quinone oxidoreductase subunit A [bacterium]|nr:NADH-quinone oxidoreductase subunit A [bacterium]